MKTRTTLLLASICLVALIPGVRADLLSAPPRPAPAPAPSGAPLSLEQFLSQVRGESQAYKSEERSARGSEERADEGQLLLSPTAFVNSQFTADGRFPQLPILLYERQYTETTSFGISKLFDFGLNAKLFYTINYLDWSDPRLAPYFPVPGYAPGAPLPLPGTFINSTTLELTQDLWSNGFGRATRAQQDALQAQALASSHRATYQSQASLYQAEFSYWRLATARQIVLIERGVLDRARKIYEWTDRRARLQLADRTDALQAEAALRLRELDVQAALDEERTASRAFNTARNAEGEDVPEALTEITPALAGSLPVPTRAPLREDVLAAREQSRATQANAELGLERDRPTLQLFGAISLTGGGSALTNQASGNTDGFWPMVAQSFSLDQQFETIGIRFSTPIDFGLANRSSRGWRLEREAADLAYQRKLFEQDQGWSDLNDKLAQAKRRLQLSVALESAQEAKLMHEKQRLQQGRTTTFQVLTFEQDYADAELQRIRSEVVVLNLLAQMKLYSSPTGASL